MFGIGMPELILILAVALIVIGPKKLPDLAKSLGRSLGEFKKATKEFKETINVENELKDVKNTIENIEYEEVETLDDKVEAETDTTTLSAEDQKEVEEKKHDE